MFIFFCFSVSRGQIPSYYQNINLNLSGDQLKNELSNLISTTHQTQVEYTSSVSEQLTEPSGDQSVLDFVPRSHQSIAA